MRHTLREAVVTEGSQGEASASNARGPVGQGYLSLGDLDSVVETPNC